ncbi:MAG: NAD(P)-dependent oxidoreductase, partial [Nitrosomonadales bacterium]
MKIAITGASGFIGQHVLTELLEHETEIIVITRGGILPAKLSSAVRTVETDISNPTPDFFEQIDCPEVLIHRAWDGLPNYKSLHHFET